ncbi:MAG: phospholipid scramblase-related protein [Actinomycetota bacterium]
MSETPADWYPDPYGRHELRYWDGGVWTDHVSSNGRQATDPVATAQAKQVHGAQSSAQIANQVDKHVAASQKRGAQVDPSAGAGVASSNLLGQRLFVVNQKAKLIEVNNEYAIYNRDGAQIGAVRQVGQSNFKKVMRVVSSLDQFFTHHLQVVDSTGQPVLSLTRPAKFVKSRVIVNDAAGEQIGEIAQNNVFGKISFALMVGGEQVGAINAENWRAWNFNIQDHSGQEVARITKTFEGVLKTAFTTADNYVVEVHHDLADPLRQLVVAAALSVDTALKQDNRGFG